MPNFGILIETLEETRACRYGMAICTKEKPRAAENAPTE